MKRLKITADHFVTEVRFLYDHVIEPPPVVADLRGMTETEVRHIGKIRRWKVEDLPEGP